MKRLVQILCTFALLVVLCTPAGAFAQEVPVVNLPDNLRQKNWCGNCVHCSLVNLLRWQGAYEWADWWVENRGPDGGESPQSMTRKMNEAGLRFAQTVNGDVSFLHAAIATRRGAAVAVQNGWLYGYRGRIAHMFNLVHLDDKVAGIVDNNFGNRLIFVDREAFLADWEQFGWAFTPLMGPPAPPQLHTHMLHWRQNEAILFYYHPELWLRRHGLR